MWHFVLFATSLASFSSTAELPATSTNEEFAHQMMLCGFKNQYYSLGPGDAAVSENAKLQSVAYIAAAAKAAGHKYVTEVLQSVKSQAQDEVFSEMGKAKDSDEIIAQWTQLKNQCDQALASRPEIAKFIERTSKP